MNFGPIPPWRHLVLHNLGPIVLIVAVLSLAAGLCARGIGAEPLTGRWMEVKASAYCPCPLCCGVRAAGLTADGTSTDAVPYGIAAHPAYLPYGTAVLIPTGQGYLDESRPFARVFRIDDTGGVIRRLTVSSPDVWIDLRFRSHASAVRWGVRSLRIFVFDTTN